VFDWSSMFLFSGIANSFFCLLILLVGRHKFSPKTKVTLIIILLCLVLILFERVIRFSHLESSYPELLFITSPIFFFILPLIFTSQKQLTSLSKFWYLHFIIPIIATLFFLPTITMDNESKLAMYNMESNNDPIVVILFYLFYAIFYLGSIFYANRKFKNHVLNQSADNRIESELLSNELIFVASLLLIAIPISFLLQYTTIRTPNVEKMTFVVFSFIPHLFLYVIFSPRRKQVEPPIINQALKEPPKEVESSVDKSHELISYMNQHKPYINQDLNLPELANSLGWNRSFLSGLINSGLDKNFYDFINEFRLNHAIERMKQGEYKQYTLEHIATNSGFKSYISFYRIFKRYHKQSPSEYIKELEKA